MEFFIQTFIALLIIIDPFCLIPIFLSLTHDCTNKEKKTIAFRAVAIAFVIILIFLLFGQKLIDLLGISEGAFRITGGVLLLWIAAQMVFSDMVTAAKANQPDDPQDKTHIAVFPLAIPMIAGPGSLVSIVLMMKEASDLGGRANEIGVIAAVVLILVVTYWMLIVSHKILRWLGGLMGVNVIVRVLGMLLAGLSVQFVIDGIRLCF